MFLLLSCERAEQGIAEYVVYQVYDPHRGFDDDVGMYGPSINQEILSRDIHCYQQG